MNTMTSEQIRAAAVEIAGSKTRRAVATFKVKFPAPGDPETVVEQVRIGLTASKEPLLMRKGSRRFGTYLMDTDIVHLRPIASTKSDADKWAYQVREVVRRLTASGLWPEIKADAEAALALGHGAMKAAYDLYWSERDDAKRLAAFKERWPSLVERNPEGKEFVNTSRLWMFAKTPRIKAMRFHPGKFGDRRNEQVLLFIETAIRERRPYTASGRTSYDVSFEYNPETRKAFYSEEFRGCGNGHYYLALDATHCVWCEDD